MSKRLARSLKRSSCAHPTPRHRRAPWHRTSHWDEQLDTQWTIPPLVPSAAGLALVAVGCDGRSDTGNERRHVPRRSRQPVGRLVRQRQRSAAPLTDLLRRARQLAPKR